MPRLLPFLSCALLLVSCGDSGLGATLPDESESSGVVAALAPIEGPAAGIVGSTMELSVRATDAAGNPVEDATVRWSASSGASITPEESQTDSLGVSTASLTVGREAGAFTASAAAAELDPIRFDLTAEPGEPGTLVLSTDSIRFLAAGDTRKVTVQAFDEYGNAVLVEGVEWSSSDPSVAQAELDGTVIARGRGVATITATLADVTAVASAYVIPYGVFTITLDDGFESAYTIGFDALDAAGLRGNVGINPITIEQEWVGYLTAAQLDEMHAAGWSVVNHTWGHIRMPTLDDAELELAIARGKGWIEAKGYNGRNVFIVPYHDWGPREQEMVRRYHKAARGQSTNPPFLDEIADWPPENPYRLTGFEPAIYTVDGESGVNSAKVRADLVGRLDELIERGQFIDIFFHRILPETEDGFRQLVIELAKRKDSFRTYHELVPD